MKARLLAPALLLGLTALGLSSAEGTTKVEQARQAPSPRAARDEALNAYRKLPLAFVPNTGQLDRRVRYVAQAGGSSFFFTRTEAMLALRKGKRGVALRLGFLGANPAPRIDGARPGTGRVN